MGSDERHQLLLLMISFQKQAISTFPVALAPSSHQVPTALQWSACSLEAIHFAATDLLAPLLPGSNSSSGSSSHLLPAVAPCLVITARTLMHLVRLLQKSLKWMTQQAAGAVSPDCGPTNAGSSVSQSAANTQEKEASDRLMNELRKAAGWAVSHFKVMLETCCDEMNSANSSSSRVGSPGIGDAAAGGPPAADAVMDMQLSELQRIQQQLESEAYPRLKACKDDGLSVLQQCQFQQQLYGFGEALCAVLPLSFCCNNPGCSNLSSSSEHLLVNGRSCVCGGCETARYCSRECQAAQWQSHKMICKAIRRRAKAKRLP